MATMFEHASGDKLSNENSLLLGLEEFIESSTSSNSDVFQMSYRGSSEVDRHYTKPMLPWIIAEIKNQNKFEKVNVEVSHGHVNVLRDEDGLLFSHSVKQFHKCVMEQMDRTHFLYTLKPNTVSFRFRFSQVDRIFKSLSISYCTFVREDFEESSYLIVFIAINHA